MSDTHSRVRWGNPHRTGNGTRARTKETPVTTGRHFSQNAQRREGHAQQPARRRGTPHAKTRLPHPPRVAR